MIFHFYATGCGLQLMQGTHVLLRWFPWHVVVTQLVMLRLLLLNRMSELPFAVWKRQTLPSTG